MRAALIGTLLKFKRSHYMQEKTLAELFADTWALIRETERVTDAETRRSNQERALSSLNAAISKTESSALFSSNEELEDVSTADLKYLLLPALRGDVLRDLVTSKSSWGWTSGGGCLPTLSLLNMPTTPPAPQAPSPPREGWPYCQRVSHTRPSCTDSCNTRRWVARLWWRPREPSTPSLAERGMRRSQRRGSTQTRSGSERLLFSRGLWSFSGPGNPWALASRVMFVEVRRGIGGPKIILPSTSSPRAGARRWSSSCRA